MRREAKFSMSVISLVCIAIPLKIQFSCVHLQMKERSVQQKYLFQYLPNLFKMCSTAFHFHMRKRVPLQIFNMQILMHIKY